MDCCQLKQLMRRNFPFLKDSRGASQDFCLITEHGNERKALSLSHKYHAHSYTILHYYCSSVVSLRKTGIGEEKNAIPPSQVEVTGIPVQT